MSARDWSAQQAEIFEWFANGRGNLVVRARAGTGKTTTILEGVNRAPEAKVLSAAFNKRIAEELTAKLRNPRAEAKTLHGVGFSFVRRNWENVRVDNDRGVRIAREVCGGTAPDAIVTLVAKLAAKGKGMAPNPKPGDLAEIAYEHDLVPDEEWAEEGWDLDRCEELAVRAMDRAAQRDGTIDFDDMVFVPVRNRWARAWWNLVVIDEAQDMNAAQLLLAQAVCKKDGRVVVVGDDRQAIYGFRGADSGSIDRLKAELGAVERPLTVTYRCAKAIVALAQTLVPDFTAADSAPEGEVIEMSPDAMYAAAAPGNFVLSRKNAPLSSVCLGLLRAGKRAKIQGKDIGRGLVALVRKLSKGNGKTMPGFLGKLARWEERETERARASGKKNTETRIQFIEDQAETLRVLAEGLAGVSELVARIESLFEDMTGPDSNFILCSSVHKAKGLEADRCFVLSDTLKPNGKLEEANITYVAWTRARTSLVLVAGIS